MPVLAALVVTTSAVAPAWAHGDDPTLVSLLTAVRPALPRDVLVQVRTGYGAQLVVANPTGTALTILDPDGVAFLRISSAGVFGNINDRYLDETANPPDAPDELPPQPRAPAEPRWVPLSRGDTWGWFERRLYPALPSGQPVGATGPAGVALQRQVLASWQVGMRYGDRPVTAIGVLERRPILGTFRTVADPRDDHLDVSIGQGQLPAIQLRVPPGRAVTVDGRDGVAFLRIGPAGASVNPGSLHFRENPQFQGLPVGQDGWVRVGDGSPVTWLDSRLRYRADLPPDDVAAGHQVAALDRWSIPVTVDGQRRALRGTVEWVPSELAAPDRPSGSGSPWTTAGLGAGAAALLAALGVLLLRTRKRMVH
ncbi:MAG TPA: hypothetical protein VGJ13_18665 [Pseudonocardiaceae bacterium]